jgi:signal transduction histidine kinase
MSSATSNTPPNPATPHDRYARQIPFRESEIADVGAQLSQITQQAATALTGVRTTFQLFDRPNRLRTVAASGGLDAAMEPAVFANGAGVAGWVAGERTAAFLPDVTRDSRFLRLRGEAERGALLCLPLIDEYTCYGTLTARANSPSRLARPVRGMLDFIARCAAMEITKFRQMEMLEAVRESSMHANDPHAHTSRIGSLMRNFLPHRVSVLVTEDASQTAVQAFAFEQEDSNRIRSLQEWTSRLFDDLRTQSQAPVPAMYTAHDYTVLAAPLLTAGTLTGLMCYCATVPIDENFSTLLCTLLINASVHQERILRRLREETERLTVILSRIQEGFLILDGSGTTILEANSAFSDLIGVQDLKMLLPLSVQAADGQWWFRETSSIVSGPDMASRWKIRPAAFPDRTLAIVESPVSIGKVLYRTWVVHDVTAISRVEQTRSEFMSIVSHELQSPFASIYGYLRLLATEKAGPLTPTQREALRTMDLCVRRLWRLIEDINDLIQSDTDELVLRLETVDFFDVIRAAVTSMMPLLQAKDIRCELEIEAPIPSVQIDPVRFHQIMTNLINNAMKFSEPGTVVIVRAYAADGAVYVSVRDAGPGVPPEDRERIFERFVRGQDTPQRDTSGLGLGLAVVRELVEKHGGNVWVENAPEGGSIFTFTIPITPTSGGSV